MSTAILISGQLRTFSRCLPLQRWQVYRHFESRAGAIHPEQATAASASKGDHDLEFFICVQDTPDVQSVDDLRRLYGADRVHVQAQPDPDLTPYITPEISAAWHRAPYANAAPADRLLLQHWYQRQVWALFTSLRDPKDFSTIIRMRGDNNFKSFALPSGLSSVLGPPSSAAFTPWWGRFGGLNDRFAIMGPEAAASYFTLWDNLGDHVQAGCPFHPESLLKAQLERDGITIHENLAAEFSTLRATGEERWPEITPIDMAHAALRAA